MMKELFFLLVFFRNYEALSKLWFCLALAVMDVCMKKFSVFFSVFLLTIFCASSLFSCKKEISAGDALDKDTSYAFGMLLANLLAGQLGPANLQFDYEALLEGFRDYNEARETRLSQDKAVEKINSVFMTLMAQGDEQRWLEGEKNQEEGEAYMATNKERSEVNTTPSGLQYEVLSEGSGDMPGADATVQVHYEGTLINGEVFDSSYTRGFPTEFPLGGVIPGWTEGLQLMREGSTYRFVIPPELAYGPYGQGSIPPNATLIFKVELLSIIR
jgi:FKBP-type peptidyl-prolyl cis-trans isomerase FkpA